MDEIMKKNFDPPPPQPLAPSRRLVCLARGENFFENFILPQHTFLKMISAMRWSFFKPYMLSPPPPPPPVPHPPRDPGASDLDVVWGPDSPAGYANRRGAIPIRNIWQNFSKGTWMRDHQLTWEGQIAPFQYPMKADGTMCGATARPCIS